MECKKGKKFTITLKNIRLDGTNFKHLFEVARSGILVTGLILTSTVSAIFDWLTKLKRI